jgi:hypothetical protein
MKIRRIAFALIAFEIICAQSLRPTPVPSATMPGEISKLRRQGLDVAIVFPTGAEMATAIGLTRKKMNELADAIHQLVPAARLGVVAYGPAGARPQVLPLTNSLEQQHAYLDSLRPSNSGKVSEDILSGLRVAIGMHWEPGAHKVIVLLAGVAPRGSDVQKSIALAKEFHSDGGRLNIVDMTEELRSEHPSVLPLDSETRKKTREAFDEIVKAGGGAVRQLQAPPTPTPWPYGPISVFAFSSLSISLAS